MPSWSRDVPHRFAYISDESGTYQVHVWDSATGMRRLVTDEPVGMIIQEMVDPQPSADGTQVVWFRDPTGDESGWWMTESFEGGAEPQKLFPGIPKAWPSGLAIGHRVAAAGFGFEEGFAVYVSVDGELREIARHHEELRVQSPEWGGQNIGGLSRDESLVCISHAEHGDNRRPALRVYEVSSGEPIGDLWDGPGFSLWGSAWSPVDHKLAFRRDLTGWKRPAIWDLDSGETHDLETDLAGEIETLDWWPDASALLLVQFLEGRDYLYKFDLESEIAERVPHPDGCVWGAGVRPDGAVWHCWDSASRSPRILSSSGEEVIVPEAGKAALTEARAYRSFHFENPSGQRVQGFLLEPDGDGPHPLVLNAHGGPNWFWGDYWYPANQALVDAGFAVALINYRGSSGYGREWEDWLVGNIGFPEVQDHVAALDALIAEGVADPERVAITGRSWGGYITLLAIGTEPERWRAAVADVPVGDYHASYSDSAPALQAWDRSLLGGKPDEIPEFVAERSPITYADRVKCPVYILYGENDSRCPPRQVENYMKALREAGGEVEVFEYDTGHASFVIEERIDHMRRRLNFYARKVPGISVPE
ncbi:MAG: alpha/beta fold hydrolase [Actinomycetota bacterium]